MPVDGSAEPRQLTAGAKRDGNPRWSPDGRLARVHVGARRGPAQLFVLPADGPGESRQLTQLTEAVEAPAWSARRVAARLHRSHARPERRRGADQSRSERRAGSPVSSTASTTRAGPRAGRITCTSSRSTDPSPCGSTDGDLEDEWPAWSPDGRTLAFTSARHPGLGPAARRTTSSLCRRAAESHDGSHHRRRVPRAGVVARRRAHRVPASPGRVRRPRHGRVAVIDVVVRRAIDPDRGPRPDGGALSDGSRADLGRRPDRLRRSRMQGGFRSTRCRTTDRAARAPIADVGGLTGFDLVGDVLVHGARPRRPSLAEIAVGERRLTDVGAAFAGESRSRSPSRSPPSRPTAREVPAWIIRPAGFDPNESYPAVLSIHGGPFTQYGERFFDEFQVYAGAGYVVLFANPRGSSGYSEEWARAIRGPVGGRARVGLGRLRRPDGRHGRGDQALRVRRPGADRR